jgi:hypothetical protein
MRRQATENNAEEGCGKNKKAVGRIMRRMMVNKEASR